MIKGVPETTQIKARQWKCRFLRMILGTSGAILLGNLLTRKGVIKAGEKTVRADQDF